MCPFAVVTLSWLYFLQVLQWVQAPWYMFIWLERMLPHGGIWLIKFDFSCGMRCWSYGIYPCPILIFSPRVLSTIKYLCRLLQLRNFFILDDTEVCVCENCLAPSITHFRIDINKLCVSPDRILTSLDCLGSWGNTNVNDLFDLIVTPFGRTTVFGGLLAIVCS